MPANFFFPIPKIENCPQKKISGHQENVTAKTNSTSVDTFHDCFVEFLEKGVRVLCSQESVLQRVVK
jgi:hypothetical protein